MCLLATVVLIKKNFESGIFYMGRSHHWKQQYLLVGPSNCAKLTTLTLGGREDGEMGGRV